jgi:Lon protease-like protein
MADELPMFPLGTVLFPSLLLPLHVFEPRYRALVRDCLRDGVEPEFGVVLIERGSEVGGGDQRAAVGTVARILQVVELPDGRFALQTAGTRRIRVRAWLGDDPYPRALVEDLVDRDAGPAGDAVVEYRDRVARKLRRSWAMRRELGAGGPDLDALDLDDDPTLASLQAAALAPLGPSDQYRLLALESTADRLGALDALLDDAIEVLTWQLTSGSAPDDPSSPDGAHD